MKVLSFLNLLDSQGKLSITNIAVVVMLVKVVMAPQVGLTEAVGLFIVLVNYGHKRQVIVQTPAEVADDAGKLQAEVEDIKTKLSSVVLSLGIKSKGV